MSNKESIKEMSNNNYCKCTEPTIVIGRQWTTIMPPSRIPPELIYICMQCNLVKENYGRE